MYLAALCSRCKPVIFAKVIRVYDIHIENGFLCFQLIKLMACWIIDLFIKSKSVNSGTDTIRSTLSPQYQRERRTNTTKQPQKWTLCSIWTEQYALCFITNTKSTCVSAEFTNQFNCYFMAVHLKFLSFFLSFFLSSFLFFFTFIKCVTLPSIHRWCNICCLFPGDDSNKHLCLPSKSVTYICLMHVLYMSTVKSNKYSLNQNEHMASRVGNSFPNCVATLLPKLSWIYLKHIYIIVKSKTLETETLHNN